MSEPVQHFFESQRLRLAYWAWGDEANPPLVMVHGGRDHARGWDPLAAVFERDYHVIAPDLRGHGDSEWAVGSEYTLAQHVVDLMALIDVVGDRVSVVGHSFGGHISLTTVGTFPDRFDAVVSIEGSFAGVSRHGQSLSPGRMERYAKVRRDLKTRQPRLYPSIEAARDRMMEANPHLTPEFALHLATHGVRETDGGYAWKFDNYARPQLRSADLRHEEARAFWGAIECPVLLLVGGQSGARRGEQDNVRHFRRARAVVVPDAGHWVHHDQFEIVASEIRRHLDGVRRESDDAG